jgi:hypothetical protein
MEISFGLEMYYVTMEDSSCTIYQISLYRDDEGMKFKLCFKNDKVYIMLSSVRGETKISKT